MSTAAPRRRRGHAGTVEQLLLDVAALAADRAAEAADQFDSLEPECALVREAVADLERIKEQLAGLGG